MNAKKDIKSTILIALFLAILILPNLIMLTNLENNQDNKQIKFKDFPELNLKEPIAFIRGFKNYYNDNFGLKTTSVKNYIDFKINFLEENPIPNRVVHGKNGWYFLGNEFSNVHNNTFGNEPFLKNELKLITQNLNSIINYLSSHGIKFYLVVPPDKNRIYQEEMPYKLNQNITKLEELKEHLKKELDFEIIDLTSTILSNKPNDLLYYKTDSHWNDYGAFLGYTEVINVISKDFTIPQNPLLNYNIDKDIIENGGTINMINLIIKEKAITLNKKTASNIITKKSTRIDTRYLNSKINLKLIMHRDSFANAWIRFFNESFGESIYLRGYVLDKTLIEKEKPDIIIFEIIERDISILSNQKSFQN